MDEYDIDSLASELLDYLSEMISEEANSKVGRLVLEKALKTYKEVEEDLDA